MVVMMDIEISCKGHCGKSSHFLDHVSHTVHGLFFQYSSEASMKLHL